ncbi:hypothetical protein [Corynebacterium terpenotabidum]|uniref:Glucitol operon activator n=1 Tax=Corynebacterium terpenotabidum Y-11 TaxID=1200352 RepID=S4XI61_9CORY|nr:hypothetical protein [Corynebacterium terpenotabidum]AGP30308.1 hypothetical protein A606_03275 [Corynebacterium terpenotabidum Y-11]
MSSDVQKNPFPLRVRIIQWCFLAAAVIATLFLAWWQWGRWHDSDGTFQNLGYAIQWPIFGIFFIVCYRKYMEYERELVNGETSPAAPRTPGEVTEISADVLPQRPAPQLSTDASGIFTDDRRRRAREARTAHETGTAETAESTGTTGTTGTAPSDENRIL